MQMPVRPPLHLSSEAKNESLTNVAGRISDRIDAKITSVLEEGGFLAGFYVMKPQERLQYYLFLTRPQDLPYIRDPDFLPKLKKGIYAGLDSPFWQSLIGIPIAFRWFASDFRALDREKIVNVVKHGATQPVERTTGSPPQRSNQSSAARPPVIGDAGSSPAPAATPPSVY